MHLSVCLKSLQFGNKVNYNHISMEDKRKDKKVTFSADTPEDATTTAVGGSTKKTRGRFSTEYLKEFLRRSFGLTDPPEKVLDEISIEGVARYIKEGRCKNIITMAGAGISTSAGIPDFRSPKTGLYSQDDGKDGKPTVQQASKIEFFLHFFKENQELFYNRIRPLWPGQHKPTPCHYFIRMLHEKGLLLRHFTQNIDCLEYFAGIDREVMIEAHGSFRSAHCVHCDERYTQEWIEEKIFSEEKTVCPDCNGIIKPDIVMFGENLPERFGELVEQDFHKCDLLIILGTSLVAQPFASLTTRVPEKAPRLYINLECTETGAKHPFMALFFGGGFQFDDEDNYRDIFWQGKCDDGCQLMVDLLEWGDEFKTMIDENDKKMDKIIAEKKLVLDKYRKRAAVKKTEPDEHESPNEDSEDDKETSTFFDKLKKKEKTKKDTDKFATGQSTTDGKDQSKTQTSNSTKKSNANISNPKKVTASSTSLSSQKGATNPIAKSKPGTTAKGATGFTNSKSDGQSRLLTNGQRKQSVSGSVKSAVTTGNRKLQNK